MSEPKILDLEKEIRKIKANMTIYYGTNHVYNHTGDNVNLEEPILLDQHYGNGGDYLTYYNQGIRIGKNVNHVNIKANALIRLNQNNQSTDIYVSIRKNGQKLTEGNFYQSGFGPFTYHIFANYIEVVEGDVIQLYIAGTNADINIMNDSTNKQTQLAVEVAD